jgi:hypothetical protein
MTERTEPIQHTDPIDGRIIMIQSIYRPARTLLEGAEYHRGPSILQPKQAENKEQSWPCKTK